MGVEGARASAARAYRMRIQRNGTNGSNPFYVNDGWDYPISQSNRHLLLHPTQVVVENPYYARMMAEVQAEETYFRQFQSRAAAAGRSIYEDNFSRIVAPPVPVSVDDAVILENMLVESARGSANQFGAVGQAIPNANRPRAVDMEVASVSSEEDEDENPDEESEEVETLHDEHDQELLDAIASVKKEMMANNEQIKSLQKKINEPAKEKKVDAPEKLPSTFRWVHIEIV